MMKKCQLQNHVEDHGVEGTETSKSDGHDHHDCDCGC